ncbi:lipid droplet-associated hydrolase [Anthonomus grandis grandis]|uniref:lipid droplet-associated hydrolase n=1 Tax=Anthonomus grandis grandis TaxID=2921223 RepID=UPI002165227D|nr:lipid droplet-associated hydrolase [Anthonomus grandis grandis]
MNRTYVEVNGVPTKIDTWGRDLNETPKTESNELIVIIPGNPGVTGFYSHFAKSLYDRTKIPVWCVGHAGHNFDEETLKKMPEFTNNKDLYMLKGQVKHKLEFLKQYIPPDTKLYLIGHSVGSYMIVENLDDPDINAKVKKAFLLFPALEHMAETKNGQFLTTYVRPIVKLLLFLTWIYTILPSFLSAFLLYIYMYIANVPGELHKDNINQLLKPGVLKRVFYLAFEEMEQMKERNNTILKKNSDKIKYYYAKDDGWVPLKFYESLKKDVPNADAQLTDINHTFVFRHSLEVANVVGDWIKAEKE